MLTRILNLLRRRKPRLHVVIKADTRAYERSLTELHRRLQKLDADYRRRNVRQRSRNVNREVPPA